MNRRRRAHQAQKVQKPIIDQITDLAAKAAGCIPCLAAYLRMTEATAASFKVQLISLSEPQPEISKRWDLHCGEARSNYFCLRRYRLGAVQLRLRRLGCFAFAATRRDMLE